MGRIKQKRRDTKHTRNKRQSNYRLRKPLKHLDIKDCNRERKSKKKLGIKSPPSIVLRRFMLKKLEWSRLSFRSWLPPRRSMRSLVRSRLMVGSRSLIRSWLQWRRVERRRCGVRRKPIGLRARYNKTRNFTLKRLVIPPCLPTKASRS